MSEFIPVVEPMEIEEEVPLCYIDKLPDSVLHRIFSHFCLEHRSRCLELVCRRWHDAQFYEQCRAVSVADLHRKFCARGVNCPVELCRRFPQLYGESLRVFLRKTLKFVRRKFGHFLESIDLGDFYVDYDAVKFLGRLPRLNDLDISSSFITQRAIEKLYMLKRLTSLSLSGPEIQHPLFDQLQLGSVRIGCSSYTDRFSGKILQNLRSLDTPKLCGEVGLQNLVEKCQKLRQLKVKYCQNIQGPFLINFFNSNFGAQLTSLAIGLKPAYVGLIAESCENLVFLNLRLLQDKLIPFDLDFLPKLCKLESLKLSCGWFVDKNFPESVFLCKNLKKFDLASKNFSKYEPFKASPPLAATPLPSGPEDTPPPTKMGAPVRHNLQVLKLSVDCIATSTEIACKFLAICQSLKTVKLMNKRMKMKHSSEHTVFAGEEFCAKFFEFFKNLNFLPNLSVFCLPTVNLDRRDLATNAMRRFLELRPLNSLHIYGGSLFATPPSPRPLVVHSHVTSLSIGPYLHALAGLENLVTSLPNLKRLSFHVISHGGGLSDLLHAIGCHVTLDRVDLRSWSKYFMQWIDVELIPLIDGRQKLRSSVSYSNPLYLNIHTKFTQASLPENFTQSLNDLEIKLKRCSLF